MANQIILARGQRSRLADLGLGAQPFTISLSMQSGGLTVDAACFGLDGQRKLSDERYMTFFNQPETPCGGVKQTAPNCFRFDLSRLPSTIDAVVITLAIEGSGAMSSLGACRATFDASAEFLFEGKFFASERAIMLVELYRKDGQWRVSAVAQGFNGGLDALVKHFGGTVQTPAQAALPPPPAPKVSLSKITVNKAREVHRICLEKTPSTPSKIVVKATWIDNGDADLAKNKKAAYVERLGRQGGESGMHLLTGSQDAIDAVTKAAGFSYRWDDRSQQFAHAGGIMIVTPEGKMSRYLYGIDYAPKDLKFGLIESGESKVGSVTEKLLLYCYHYDPATGKYGLAVLRIMRIGGILTVAGLGAMVFVFCVGVKRKS